MTGQHVNLSFTGKDAEYLHRFHRRVGVDLSKELIAHLQKKFGDQTPCLMAEGGQNLENCARCVCTRICNDAVRDV